MEQDRGQGFFVSGGTMPLNSASYLERAADKALFTSLLDGRFCFVLNSRQLGKSSLSVHTIGRLQAAGARTAFLDLTRFGGKNLSAEQWYTGLAMELARELGYRRPGIEYWKENGALPPVVRLFGMIRDVILADLASKDGTRLVVFFDEIDSTRTLPFDADEFYAAIRECFNRRVADPVFENLTFCLLGVAVPSDLIRSRATTPFNIGERISLEDFTLGELFAYSHLLGPNGKAIVQRVHYWTGGHPFLSQSLCASIAALGTVEEPRNVDEIVRRELFDYKARESNTNLADVANIALYSSEGDEDSGTDAASFRATLLSDYLRIRSGKPVIDDESNRVAVLLKLSGIVRSDGRRLHVRNRIYEHVFDGAWIEQHMPKQELRRQRQSYRRGVWRAASILGLILAAIGSIATFAWISRQQAIEARNELAYKLYVADMNGLRLLYDNGDTGRIEPILNRYRNSPYRGFEWGFWMGKYHDGLEEFTLDYDAPGKKEEGHCSSDGKEICIVDKLTSTATFVDRASKRRLRTIPLGQGDSVVALTGKWAVLKQTGHSVELIDPVSRGLIFRFKAGNQQLVRVDSHDYCDYLLTSCAGAGSQIFTRDWNIFSGKEVFRLPSGDISDPVFYFSRSGNAFMWSVDTGGQETKRSREARIHSVADGQEADHFSLPADVVLDAFADQGEWVLYHTEEGKYFLRDCRAHQTSACELPAVGVFKRGLSLPRQGAVLMLLNGDRCAEFHIPVNGKGLIRENVASIQPGPDPNLYIASANSVRLCRLSTPAGTEVIAHGSRVTRYDAQQLNVFMPGNRVQRIRESDCRPTAQPSPPGDQNALTYSGHWFMRQGPKPGTQTLVSGDRAPTLFIPLSPDIWSVSADGSRIATRSGFNQLSMFDGPTHRVKWSRSDVSGIESLWVSRDALRLYVGNQKTGILTLDAQTGATLGHLNSHNSGPVAITFSADGRFVFTCGGDGRVVMWEARTNRKIQEFRGNEQQAMTSADLSYDGRRLVTTNMSGAWQLWDASNGVQLLDVQASQKPLSSALFTADGRRIITAGDDGEVREWTAIDRDPTVRIPIDSAYLAKLHL